MQDFIVPYASDDGTLTHDNPLYRASAFCVEAGNVSGRRNNVAPHYKTYMERAGFVDVVERRFKWPLNDWPKDSYYKELGIWCRENVDMGAEGMFMALFTRYLGWTKEQVVVFCAEVRAALRDRSVHGYCSV